MRPRETLQARNLSPLFLSLSLSGDYGDSKTSKKRKLAVNEQLEGVKRTGEAEGVAEEYDETEEESGESDR